MAPEATKSKNLIHPSGDEAEFLLRVQAFSFEQKKYLN